MPDPERLDNVPVPPLGHRTTSDNSNPATLSLNVKVTVTVSPALSFAVPTRAILDTVGAVVSMTIAFVFATFAPAGSAVDVIALPAVSATVPMVKLVTVRSDVV